MQENLSEYRKVLYVASTPNFDATFTTGKREEPYLLNGVSEKKVEYGVLTVKFNKEIYENIFVLKSEKKNTKMYCK